MFGFRAKLSTQDVLLQLKEEVLSNVPRNSEHVIMALDIKGAFDNVSHEAILTGMDSLNCGRRIHGYVKAFLSNRTATIGLGAVRSEKFRSPNKGTPQGSVISPSSSSSQ
ncbi:uncharacterized protein LOC142567767 [Dermacentor variabilis]|uniref:uncharacterized protein LOC142567767 n=1 Tax=Dermacentor variabilis TaxID=34621 RepID=UPI003F5BCA7E